MLLRGKVRVRVFLFIPDKYESFLRGNYNVMSYSMYLIQHYDLLAAPRLLL